MSKLISEVKVYEYENKEDLDREIKALKNSEWKVYNTYEFGGKWRAEYIKDYV
jgi:hypothetical protein